MKRISVCTTAILLCLTTCFVANADMILPGFPTNPSAGSNTLWGIVIAAIATIISLISYWLFRKK